MERIQSALAKARATRGEQAGQPARRLDRPAQTGGEPPRGARAAWEAVQRVEPDPGSLKANRIVAGETATTAVEFNRLRTSVLQRMQNNDWRRIAVVSPTMQNGKSTVSLNLALSFARHSNLNAIAIELDLLRPTVAQVMGLDRSLDVTRVLAGEAPLAEHAVRPRDNLIVAPAHSMRNGSAEFLQSPTAARALSGVMTEFEPSVMIYDMPPLSAGDDTIGFLSNVDCALIVAAAGTSTITEIDRCEREVAERTAVMGIVLNKCRYETNVRDYDYY